MRVATRVMALRPYLASQLKTQRKWFYKEARQYSHKGSYTRTYSRQHKEQPRTQQWTQVLILRRHRPPTFLDTKCSIKTLLPTHTPHHYLYTWATAVGPHGSRWWHFSCSPNPWRRSRRNPTKQSQFPRAHYIDIQLPRHRQLDDKYYLNMNQNLNWSESKVI